MTKLTTTAAREAFSDVVNRAAYGKERVLLTRRGKGLVAVVPVEDLELLEHLEDRIDVDEARKALADMKRKRQKTVPLSRIKRELGI